MCVLFPQFLYFDLLSEAHESHGPTCLSKIQINVCLFFLYIH